MKHELAATVAIREHKHGSTTLIRYNPAKRSANSVVEKWGRGTIHYAVHGTHPAVTWTIIDTGDPVSAMIRAATRLPHHGGT